MNQWIISTRSPEWASSDWSVKFTSYENVPNDVRWKIWLRLCQVGHVCMWCAFCIWVRLCVYVCVCVLMGKGIEGVCGWVCRCEEVSCLNVTLPMVHVSSSVDSLLLIDLWLQLISISRFGHPHTPIYTPVRTHTHIGAHISHTSGENLDGVSTEGQ